MTQELRPESLWHVTRPNDFLLHNARLGKGWTWSISAVAQGKLASATTLYAAANEKDEKEAAWEDVRLQEFKTLPPRLKAFFAFQTFEDAQRAMEEWFANDDRQIVEVNIAKFSDFHVADARWLDATKETWPANATRYWQGDRTDDPRLEVIIHGALYFPDWQRFPSR